MLRIILVTGFLIFGSVKLHTYKILSSTKFVAPVPLTGNSYIRIAIPQDSGMIDIYPNYQGSTNITFLQDITTELGFQLTMEWRDRHMEILQDTEYQDFCSALENKTLQTNPYHPDPIAMLGLSGQYCPVKQSTILFPWSDMPRTIQTDFAVECNSWINFVWRIEAKNSTKENPVEYLRAGVFGFTPCPQ